MFRDRRSAVLDIGISAFVTVVALVLAWTDRPFLGDPLVGPLAPLLPLVLGPPLLLRRHRPLLVCCTVWFGLAAYSLAADVAPEGLECVVAFAVSSYSVAAYSPRRRAVMGLAVILASYAVYTWEVSGIRDDIGDQWASAFFATMTLACWLLGFGIHGRREELTLIRRTEQLQHASDAAVQDERDRIARELHDIVSHRLSVVVVQAAGARAQGDPASGTLEKIEGQAREALVEMRRMLGLLRDDDDPVTVVPSPDLGQLPGLVESVREAGLPVALTVTGDVTHVPKAVALSAYRIVQESLTNALRHSGARKGSVCVEAATSSLLITVSDDGHGFSDPAEHSEPGHGLVGMRERVQLLGGSLDVASTQHGVSVHAVLPLDRTPA